MPLSELTKSNIDDAKSHIRGALRSAASNDSPMVVSFLSKILQELDMIEKHEKMEESINGIIQRLGNPDKGDFMGDFFR